MAIYKIINFLKTASTLKKWKGYHYKSQRIKEIFHSNTNQNYINITQVT